MIRKIAEVNPKATYWIFDDRFLESVVKTYFDAMGVKYVWIPTAREDWKKWDTGEIECPFDKAENA